MNDVNLIGSVVGEPELTVDREGHDVGAMHVADPRRGPTGDPEPCVIYVDVTAFGRLARSCASELTEGRRVGVSGRLERDDALVVSPLCHHGPVPRLDRSLPIAVFDSGVGGLTVLHELLVWLPHEDFVYLGDTARFPYGGRDPQLLRDMAVEIGSYLVEGERAKLVVVACNSAAAAGLPRISEATGIAVVGVIAPAARQAVRATQNNRVGLLATPATVASGAYDRAIESAGPGTELVSVPCPKLAPLIQEGGALDPSVIDIVDEYCEPLHAGGVDTVILGCTHYPIVRSVLQRALGREVTLVSSGQAIADEVERELSARRLDNEIDRRGSYRFLCTGDPEAFRAVAARSLGLPVVDVAQVHVETLAAMAAS